MNHQPSLASHQTVPPDFGPLVFEIKCEDFSRVVFLLGLGVTGIGLIFLFVAVTAGLSASLAEHPAAVYIFLTAFLAAGGGAIWFAKHSTPFFRCHENGLAYAKRKLMLILPFEQVRSFTWDETIKNVNLGYSHNTVKLRFEPKNSSSPAISATITHKVRGGDRNLEKMKNALANRIADAMQALLKEGKTAEWLIPEGWLLGREACTFHFQGLEIFKGKNMTSGTVVPFELMSGYRFGEGALYLTYTTPGETSLRTLVVEVKRANFFPGWHLLSRLAAIPEAPKPKLWERMLGGS